jgi:hypothetical protein
MAEDIFGRESTLGGAIASDAAKIVFAGGGDSIVGGVSASGGVGLLTQNLQISYQQQVTRIYEVGSNFTFLVAGRAQGTLGLGRVLGPRAVQTQFYRNYGNVCNASNNNLALELAAGCHVSQPGDLGKISLVIRNVVLISIGFNVGSQDMVIGEQLQGLFVALDFR